MGRIEIVSRNRYPSESYSEGENDADFATLLRQRIEALAADEALRVQAAPRQPLTDLRREIVACADAAGVPIVVDVLRDESGLLVKRADHTAAAAEPTVFTDEATGPRPRGRLPE